MRLPSFLSLLPFATALGCSPEAPDSSLLDSGDPDTDRPSSGLPELARQAYMAVHMPQQLPLLTYGLSHYAAEGCPLVTEIEDELTLTGDCAWSQGELQGSVSFSATRVVWTDWSMSFGDGTVVAVSGEQVFGDDGALTTDMVVVAKVVAVPLLPNGDGTYRYTDYVVSDWLAYLGDPHSEGNTSDLSGTMAIEDFDTFTVRGTVTEDQQCGAYVDSLDLTLEGLETTLSYTVTPDPCDACVDWDSDTSESGTFCLGG